jgi:hypothetical protein
MLKPPAVIHLLEPLTNLSIPGISTGMRAIVKNSNIGVQYLFKDSKLTKYPTKKRNVNDAPQ